MSKLDAFSQASKRAGVVWVGLFVLGLGFGVVVVDSGLAWWWAPIISATVFAGSMEFLLVGLIASTAPLVTIALTTFLVNFRHVFYGLTYPLERFRGATKIYLVGSLVDEAFALVSTMRNASSGVIFWTHLGLHVSWTAGSLVGALLGVELLADVQGLDFVLIALFIVLAIDAWRIEKDWTSVCLALIASGIGLFFGHRNMMLVAMLLLVVMLVVRYRRLPRA